MMLVFTSLIIPASLVIFATTSSATEKCKPKACSRDSDNEKAVCGSDGISYPNRCLFERAHCQNQNLTVLRKRGPCKQQRSCQEATAYANQHPEHGFRPQCHPDGSYESAQCHEHTGHCWCVTPQGLPLPYTTAKYRRDTKPRCGRKKSTWRRSARNCARSDKVVFNNKLLNNFKEEYSREFGVKGNETMVLEWKFRNLDGDGNGILNKAELRAVLQVAKKAIKPKQCAKWKNFLNSCGVIGDRPIGKQEWGDCFSQNGMDDGRPGISNTEDQEEPDSHEGPFRSPPHGVLSSGLPPMGQGFEDDSAEIRDDDPTDCTSDRQTALAEGNLMYVPECTMDGRYQKIQCYKSAGYCWCVHEDTGKNIPGTSIKNGTPKCEQLNTISRPMKGCPEEKKAVFLTDLMQFLHKKMSETVDGNATTFNGLAWIASKEEQAATWSFVVLDKNKNKILDRAEWKIFKDMVSSIKSLKKCGKKLPRYCDINKDRQISMTEWLDCLNVVQHAVASPSTAAPSSRLGKKNPLTMLLED